MILINVCWNSFIKDVQNQCVYFWIHACIWIKNNKIYHLYKLRELDILKLLDLEELGGPIKEGVRNPDRTLEGDDDGFNVPIEVLGLE